MISEMREKLGKEIEALTLAGSPGGKVQASSAYVGLADPAGIGNQDLTGKIAVADRGTLNFIDKYANVKAKGDRPKSTARNLFKEHPRQAFLVMALTAGGTLAFYAYSIYGQRFLVKVADSKNVRQRIHVLLDWTPAVP